MLIKFHSSFFWPINSENFVSPGVNRYRFLDTKFIFTGAIDSVSKSVQSFSDTLAKLAPLETSTSNVIDRQRLLVEVKNDPDHVLWQLQER